MTLGMLLSKPYSSMVSIKWCHADMRHPHAVSSEEHSKNTLKVMDQLGTILTLRGDNSSLIKCA